MLNVYLCKKIMEIHIGEIVRRVIREKKVAVQPITVAIGISEGGMSRIYKSPSLQSSMLQKLSVALKYDFFEIYTKDLNLPKEEIKKEEVVVVNVVSDSEKILQKEIWKLQHLKRRLVISPK